MIVTATSTDSSSGTEAGARSALKYLEDKRYHLTNGADLVLPETRYEDDVDTFTLPDKYHMTSSFEGPSFVEARIGTSGLLTALSRDLDYYTCDGSRKTKEQTTFASELDVSAEVSESSLRSEWFEPDNNSQNRYYMDYNAMTSQSYIHSHEKSCSRTFEGEEVGGQSDPHGIMQGYNSSSCDTYPLTGSNQKTEDLALEGGEPKIASIATETSIYPSQKGSNTNNDNKTLSNFSTELSNDMDTYHQQNHFKQNKNSENMTKASSASWSSWMYSSVFGPTHTATFQTIKMRLQRIPHPLRALSSLLAPSKKVEIRQLSIVNKQQFLEPIKSITYSSSIEVSVDDHDSISKEEVIANSFSDGSQVYKTNKNGTYSMVGDESIEQTKFLESNESGLLSDISQSCVPMQEDSSMVSSQEYTVPSISRQSSTNYQNVCLPNSRVVNQDFASGARKKGFKFIFGKMKRTKAPYDELTPLAPKKGPIEPNFQKRIPLMVHSLSSENSLSKTSSIENTSFGLVTKELTGFSDFIASPLISYFMQTSDMKKTSTTQGSLAPKTKNSESIINDIGGSMNFLEMSFSTIDSQERKTKEKTLLRLKKLFKKHLGTHKQTKLKHASAFREVKKMTQKEIEEIAEKEVRDKFEEGFELIAGVTTMGKKAIVISNTKRHCGGLFEA
jgi:hypothetical protein